MKKEIERERKRLRQRGSLTAVPALPTGVHGQARRRLESEREGERESELLLRSRRALAQGTTLSSYFPRPTDRVVIAMS